MLTIPKLYNLNETIAASLFAVATYPWELLPRIGDHIIELGRSLSPDRFIQTADNIWIARSAQVAPTAVIGGPAIIDEEAQIRHCAYIRGNVIVGKRAVVGNSTELKNALLFNEVQVPHYNYVGDSILGFRSHLGAGAVVSNLKSDKSLVQIKIADDAYATGLKKCGALLGDQVEVGCGSVLNPGTVIGRESIIYPLSMVRGYIPPDSIYKNQGEVILKQA
ncbi:MAG: UDP-N-acetylglucosamine pyrophosphorylase [Lachnospiraceae bacterium]|nr:UDP-N-acetylglucosamine pyrophosphorylase [Lachnospiraceae bacterium]